MVETCPCHDFLIDVCPDVIGKFSNLGYAELLRESNMKWERDKRKRQEQDEKRRLKQEERTRKRKEQSDDNERTRKIFEALYREQQERQRRADAEKIRQSRLFREQQRIPNLAIHPKNIKEAYEFFGERATVDNSVIVKKYRALSLIHHPDITKGDDVIMKRLNAAYSIIIP
jgi:ATPase subunit of ABC transporter with duplicated ATPase domains